MGLFRKNTQAKYERRVAATQEAASRDDDAKQALMKKMNKKGGAGRLTSAEIRLARRMGLGEGQD